MVNNCTKHRPREQFAKADTAQVPWLRLIQLDRNAQNLEPIALRAPF